MKNSAFGRHTFVLTYWIVCVIVAWVIAQALVGRMSFYFGTGAIMGLVAITTIRVRNKMKIVSVVLALSSIAVFAVLFAHFSLTPIGYGGQAAGIFFLLPLAGGLIGLGIDMVGSNRLSRRKDKNTEPRAPENNARDVT